MVKSKYSAVIIGAGKIAWSAAAALRKNNITITSVISRNPDSARLLASKFKINHCTSDICSALPEADLYLLTVPDGKIKSVADKISGMGFDFSGKMFLHFSGVESSEILSSLAEKGGIVGSVHIMQTFPSREVIDISGCNAAVESFDKKYSKQVLSFARAIKLKPFLISSEGKTLYHLSGVLASNFTAGNFYIADKISGGNYNTAKLLSGIAEKTIKNITVRGAVNSLSGPIERGDYRTIKRHIEALQAALKTKKGTGSLLISYISQSLVLLELVKEKNGKLSPAHKKINKLLKEELQKTII